MSNTDRNIEIISRRLVSNQFADNVANGLNAKISVRASSVSGDIPRDSLKAIAFTVTSAFLYECFRTGFHELIDEIRGRDEAAWQASFEDDALNLELFKSKNTGRWIVYFWDSEGDDAYFGDFWLTFPEDRRDLADFAFTKIFEFIGANMDELGVVPPATLEPRLYEVFGVIRRAAAEN